MFFANKIAQFQSSGRQGLSGFEKVFGPLNLTSCTMSHLVLAPSPLMNT